MLYSKHETSGVATRPRHAIDESGGDRTIGDHEHDGHFEGGL
jgi:hypothetical protein